MKRILAIIAGGRGGDHRAVFSEFAQCLERMLRRPEMRARVRVVRG